jgi:transposase
MIMKKGEKFERLKINKKEYEHICTIEFEIKSARILRRIQAIKLIYLGWKYGKIATFLNLNNETITNWFKLYKDKGIDEYLNFKYQGRQSRLSKYQLNKLRYETQKGQFQTAKEIKSFIKKEFGLEYNSNYIQELAKKNFTFPLKRQN